MQLTTWFLHYSMFTTHSLIAAVVLNHSYKTALITYCGMSKIQIMLVTWIKIQYVQDWNQLKWKNLSFYNHFNTNYLCFQCVLYKNLETLWVHFVFRFFNWNLHPCSAFVCFVLFFTLKHRLVRIRILYESLLGNSARRFFTPTSSSQPISVLSLTKVGIIYFAQCAHAIYFISWCALPCCSFGLYRAVFTVARCMA